MVTTQACTATRAATGRPAGRLTVLDLFAGAGGLSAGLACAGSFDTVEAVELDLAAAATYAANHPGSRVFAGSIQDWLSEGDVPEVDVIVGGPPCQGFSTLGKQDAEDRRNDLWEEYAKTIVKAQPRYFVLENVAAFRKSPQYAQIALATATSGLLGDYAFECAVLNAADFGAFQARRRAVLIGHHRDLAFPGWPTRTHLGEHRTVREALRGVPATCAAIDLPRRTTEFEGHELPGRFSTTELHLGRFYEPRSIQRFQMIPPGGNRFDLPDELQAPCWRKHTSGSGDVMGRLHWGRPSVTIRTEFF